MPAIKFSINDVAIEKKVREVLDLNNILTNVKIREDIRNLVKYGDFAYLFKFYVDDEDEIEDEYHNIYSHKATLTESITNKKSVISKPLRPEQIQITYIPPEDYDLEAFRGQVYSLKSHGMDNEEYMPWELNKYKFPA
jgi:hypothetical protein